MVLPLQSPGPFDLFASDSAGGKEGFKKKNRMVLMSRDSGGGVQAYGPLEQAIPKRHLLQFPRGFEVEAAGLLL